MWREVGRNLATGTTRAVTFGVCLAVIVGALCLAELGTLRDILHSERDYRASGADITILTASGRIDGKACDQLVDAPGVIAAGAIRETRTRLSPTVLPDAPLPISDISSGFRALVEAPSGNGIALGPEAQQALGARSGARVATATGPVTVAGSYSYPDDGRRGGLRYAALAPSTSSVPFDECWVRQWPQSDEVNSLLLLSMIPQVQRTSGSSADMSTTGDAEDTQPPSFSQLNSAPGTRFGGLASFESRATKWSSLVAGIAALGLAYVSIRLRRLPFASALHAGVARSDLVLMALAETGVWVAGGLIIASPAAAITAAGTAPPDGVAMLALGGAIAVAAGVGGLLGAFVAATGTRERHLFCYFTDR
ncbi:hypothetical protein [Leifsonia xyli]|uniref:hypothetical protein n=1 Tax=Leifsonia xyli TaxID=1575 RepID=UPI003D66D7FE